jgi:aminopeptidase 2
MENWGLVTYREEAVLFDPKLSDNDTKEEVAYTVGHELAHQWFGNLVTMDWWDELWLNEGFATFVGWLAVDKLFPEWNVFTNFVGKDYNFGATVDSQRSSHAIQVEVNSAAEIDQIFDAISYSKGASVIRMLEAFLGRDNFAKGVNQYLKAHQYGNATTIDLWKHLSKASGQNVDEMMKNWTLTVGYPAVHILSETYCKESQDIVLELKQERLLSTGDLKPEEDLAVWFIPISVTTKNGTTKHILSTKTGKICFPYTNDKDDFYKLNSKVTGFYRVCYTVSQLQMLGFGLLNHNSKFSVEDRIGILSEVFSFAKSGLISSSGALELLSGYRNEESYM